mgnify:CR=1 FL=1
MSGHSKWKTIQHKKGSEDAKRGRIFSKLSREISIASRAGGADPNMNPSLRALLHKAHSANMPAENIERAIKKGTGELAGAKLEEVIYEGYATGGIAMIVKVLTDNKNRAAADIRHIFTRFGSNLATQGAVMRNFRRKGQILVDASKVEEDKLFSIVLDAGAEDMQKDNNIFEIVTIPQNFNDVVEALEKANIPTLNSEITLLPISTVPISEKAAASTITKFIEALEDSDEVQDVYTNVDFDDAILKELEEK